MASIRQLKKDINNDISFIIEEIYLWELSNPSADMSKSEKLIDEEILNGSKKGKKVFNRSLRGVGLSDLLIIHNWLNYAKLIKDESYKDITNEIFFSEYIFQAVKRRDNQN